MKRFPDMQTYHVDNDAEVELFDDDTNTVEWAGPFKDFCASNKFDGYELRDIEQALVVDGEFFGGIGGGGSWHLRMAQAEGI